MKHILIILITWLIAIHSYSQEKKLTFRGYISPSICKSPTQYRTIIDNNVSLTDMTKSSRLFFGAGIEMLRKLNQNWFVGGDLGFVSKGYFALRETNYQNGSLSGTGFARTDLNFLETTLLLEKQLSMKNPENRILLSAGLFYGLHLPNITSFGVEANGNDLGTSLSLGLKRKRFFAKLNLKNGFINIKNNIGSSFKTNILSFKIGYSNL